MAMANKGYVMPMWSYQGAGAAQNALAQAKATGANSVEIDYALTTGPNGYGSSTVSHADRSSVSNLLTVIDLAHQQGLDVWVKPVLEVGSPNNPSHVNWGALAPQNPQQWFQSYTQVLKDLGGQLQAHGVSHYIITNELASMTTNPAYAGEWVNLISQVRTTFKGAIGFNSGAFWGSGGSEFQGVPESVVANLDFMGLSAYPRFSNQPTTESVGQVQNGWFSDVYGRNDIGIVNNWIASHPGKPLYFTELGSPQVSGGYYNISRGAQEDHQDQANYLLGSLQTIGANAPGVRGAFVYEWSLSPQGGNYTWNVDQSPIITNALTQGWHYA